MFAFFMWVRIKQSGDHARFGEAAREEMGDVLEETFRENGKTNIAIYQRQIENLTKLHVVFELLELFQLHPVQRTHTVRASLTWCSANFSKAKIAALLEV